jgi:hypothetical protein
MLHRLLPLVLLSACTPAVCGTAEYVFVYPGGGGEMFDTDGDGDADLVEHCGVDAGMFGYSRDDYGLTELTLSPDTPEDTIESTGDMSAYILPGASVAFLTSHLTVGTSIGMEALAGSGLHKLGGTETETYATYDLLDGTLEVLDGPRESTDPVYEGYASWQLRWNFTFGDPMNGMELQMWDAEDWVQLGPGSTIGEPLDLPPDWVAPA